MVFVSDDRKYRTPISLLILNRVCTSCLEWWKRRQWRRNGGIQCSLMFSLLQVLLMCRRDKKIDCLPLHETRITTQQSLLPLHMRTAPIRQTSGAVCQQKTTVTRVTCSCNNKSVEQEYENGHLLMLTSTMLNCNL